MERQREASFVKEARLAFEYSLSNFIWKQAVFFAERLVAECPCEETTYLLALAYFHNQETGRAYWHLQGNKLPEARYLMARCCFLLQKWEEAEDSLCSSPPNIAGASYNEVVNGAAGLYLLGQVKEKQSKRDQAIECYAKCLEVCPFMWDAYERWSWLILGSPSPSRSSTSSMAANTFSDDKFTQTFSNSNVLSGHTGLQTSSPPGMPVRPVLERIMPYATSGNLSKSQNAPPRNDRDGIYHGPPRKERRAEPQRLCGGNHVPGMPHSTAAARDSKEYGQGRRHPCSENSVDGGEVSLASLLCKLGIALHAMHNFESLQTINLLSTLPRRHYETGYILDLVGLCYFESADYKKAESIFQQVWRLEPRRVEGLEYYSSALWHLRKDIELGHLAQQCLQWDRLKPQVWCVVGNCFSLQKEHDVAIKFFKRAIQVDPSFTYAYTLCGHEFVANEKLDKAIPMYEHALAVDSRHYNAWWGLGNIYHRQEEHENARYHFLKALEINRSNSVLRCYLGMVLDSLNNPLMALENFDRASQGEPQNGMAYFQKACVLMSLDRFQEALEDLKKVRCLAPKEACVHFQLGKVYQKLQRDKKALLHFNIAMDLNRDSKDYHTIKTHIERLQIRGLNDYDVEGAGRRSQGRLRSTSSSSTACDDRERADTRGAQSRDQAQNMERGVEQLEQAHTFHGQAGGSPHPGASQRHGGSTSPGGRPAGEAPMTSSYGTVMGRNLWSGRGGPSAFHSGRGGSPPSWGTPSTSFHAPPGSGFRI